PDTVLGFSCGVSCSSAFFTSCSAVCEGVGRFSDSFVSFFECCEKSCGFFVSFLHDSLCAFLSLFPSSVPFFFHGCLIKLYTSRIGTVSDRVFKIIARKKGHKNGPKRKPTIPAAIQKSRYFMINAFHFFSIELLPFSGKKYFPAVNQIQHYLPLRQVSRTHRLFPWTFSHLVPPLFLVWTKASSSTHFSLLLFASHYRFFFYSDPQFSVLPGADAYG